MARRNVKCMKEGRTAALNAIDNSTNGRLPFMWQQQGQQFAHQRDAPAVGRRSGSVRLRVNSSRRPVLLFIHFDPSASEQSRCLSLRARPQ